MAAVETYPERYADPLGFAREVNLPLLGTARVRAVPAGAGLAQLLEASSGSEALGPIVESLTETRRSLTLRSLLLAGFPHDPECFAVGLSLAREWSRRGLRVAVVDLDFWNPTISRPLSHPNEGLVDVLEYGCSFGRVAWELVADRLWLIGPGSHPPDESRIAEHPDWARASRVFGGCVDVALYVAPLLDRRGFTGKLSKRMDAALLAASVERVGRADLRDAFLELWGSDAPMIGCVGIEPVDSRVAGRARTDRPAAGDRLDRTPASDRGRSDREPAESSPWVDAISGAGTGAASSTAAGAPASAASAAPQAPARASAARDRKTDSPERRAPVPLRSVPERSSERDLEAALERDVRRGIVEGKHAAKGRTIGLWIGAAAMLAVAVGVVTQFQKERPEPPRGSVQSPQAAGEEPINPSMAGLDERGNLDDPSAPIGAVDPAGPGAATGVSGGSGAAIPPQGAPERVTSERANTPPASPLRAGLGGGTGVLPGGASKPDAAKRFRVHVASFRTESKVQEIVQALRGKKLDAWFEPPPAGGDWYRVFVGRFATEAEAKTYAAWLVQSGAVDRAQSYPQTKR